MLLVIFISKSNITLMLLTAIPDCFLQSRQFYYTQIGMDGKYINANSYFLETFGFSLNNLSKTDSLNSVHSDDHELCKIAAKECIEKPGKPVSVTLRKPTTENDYVHTRWEFSFIADADEPYIQCIGLDITEQINSTDSLQKIQQKILSGNKVIDNLLSNSIDIILVVDERCTISFCSPNIYKEMGYEPEELIGKTGFSFVHPEDIGAAIKIFEDEIKQPNQNKSVDVRFLKKDGSWLWAESKGKNMLTDPLVQGIIINLNNITIRKKAEDELIKSENRYRSFFENLPYPLFLINPVKGNIVNCNQSAIQKYGYALNELQQMSLADLFEEQPDSLQLNEMYQQQVVARHRTKNGDLVIAKLEQYNMQFDDSGYQLILTNDVTDSYNRQQESQLAFEISSILMKNAPFDQTLEKALQKLRKFTGWDLVELWVPAYDLSFIRNDISAFYRKHPMAEEMRSFISATRTIEFTKAVYWNSRIYQNKKPNWIENIETDDTVKRKQLALETGFKSILSIPIINEGKVVCSIFLFSFHTKKQNAHAEKLIVTLGSLIGTELEKHQRELELERFFNISPDIMTIAGLDGRFIKVNPAFEKFIGYTEAEAKELHPLHYVFGEDRELVLQKLIELSNGISIPYFENRIVTKTGEVKWIAWTATPVFAEGMIIATHRDITANKQIEERLRLSNERYELATKATTNEAIWDLDLKNNEITWSEVFTNLFGYTLLKDEPTLEFWEKQLHVDDKERVVNSFRHFLEQSQNPYWYCEYRFKRYDGTYAYIVDRGYLIFDNANKPIRVVGAMEDITERKKLEDELIFKERSRQKQIANAAFNAQEKERSNISKELHDNVSQMLTSTKLFLDILKNKAPDELIDRSIKNINSIIEEIRNMSRSLMPLSIEDLGIIGSINDLIDNIRIANIVDVEFYPDNEVEKLLNANAKLILYRIVQEQINNIVKHANAKNILIELFAENNYIELILSDDGIGFDLETVKKGLGLRNMKSRAQLLNGTTEIITNPNKGCKLKVHIPYQ